jgi:hypothetical protein
MAIFQATNNMFSAYLNQDFDLLFGAADDAICAFVRHSSQDEILRVVHELRDILLMKLSEEDMKKLILQDLGACYYYPIEWSSAEVWLEHVLALIEEMRKKLEY